MTVTYPEWTVPFMDLSVSQAEAQLNHYPTSSEGNIEGGVDWTPSQPGTPITALAPGVVIGAGYFCKNPDNFFASSWQTCGGSSQGYGVVTTRVTNSDGSQTDIYYQHIIIASNIKLSNTGGSGQTVQYGQVIGYSNPSFNVEVGVNPPDWWGGIWGDKHPGPHVDPIPYLNKLIQAGASGTMGIATTGVNGSGGYSSVFGQVAVTVMNAIGLGSMVTTLQAVQSFTGLFGWYPLDLIGALIMLLMAVAAIGIFFLLVTI